MFHHIKYVTICSMTIFSHFLWCHSSTSLYLLINNKSTRNIVLKSWITKPHSHFLHFTRNACPIATVKPPENQGAFFSVNSCQSEKHPAVVVAFQISFFSVRYFVCLSFMKSTSCGHPFCGWGEEQRKWLGKGKTGEETVTKRTTWSSPRAQRGSQFQHQQ